jgi:hypothetical protein
MLRTILGTMTAAVLAAACSSTPKVMPLSGTPADIRALDGQWIGSYHTYDPSGRSGTLLFRFEAGQDTARGDVLMHVAGRETADVIPFTTDPWADVAPDRILKVTFVRAAGGTIFGRFDIYNDPVCGCEVQTTMTGRINGNLIEGTYNSVHLNGADRNTGRWRVVRTFAN